MQIVETADDFVRDATAGFVAAYARYVRPVPGASAVARRGRPRPGKVAVVIGGGSGHYPAFCGLVGTGVADAAVIGEVFTSPSAEQAYRTAAAVDSGAGILMSYGNYAGDVLNFGAAQERLRSEGRDCRTVLVTDDIASAPPDNKAERRGIAGDFVVFKIAGAAAERGDRLDEVERLAQSANARTTTFGVAFGGCTLPGAPAPLFTVAPGSMELGLGIHGEPGVHTVTAATAGGLAQLLAEPLLAERPRDADGRVALLVNGLGATKYEELFVLYRHLLQVLEPAELTIVTPEIGELVTSLDMRGASVTITWLDDELDELWQAPADTPAFRRGRAEADCDRTTTYDDGSPAEALGDAAAERVAADSAAAVIVRRGLAAALDEVRASEQKLGQLDAVAGDGDHGSAMVRGLGAAVTASDATRGRTADLLEAAGQAFADRGAGTSGMLWGVMLAAAATSLRSVTDDESITPPDVAAAVRRALDEIGRVGGAVPGERTLVDALAPFARTLASEVDDGTDLRTAWARAAGQAQQGADATAEMLARRGRARPLAERALGTPDPGAESLARCVQAVARAFS